MNYKIFLDPKFFFNLLFTLQFVMWILFFPDYPTVSNGNLKIFDFQAFFVFFVFFVVMNFAFLVSHIFFKNKYLNFGKLDFKLISFFAKFCLIVSFVAILFKFKPLLYNPELIFDMLKPSGINKIHSELSYSAFGVSTLSYLWLFSLPFYSYFYFKLKYFKFEFYSLFALIVAVSVLNMTRTVFFVFIFGIISSYLLAKKPKVKISLIFITILLLFSFYWVNAYLRTGILYASENGLGFLSLEVHFILLQEFIEKYFVGEFNNSLIIFSHSSDILSNFAHGTILNRFFPSTVPAGYFLNTMNFFGFIYWQFGIFLGCILVFLTFFTFNALYCTAISESKRNVFNYGILLYCFVYPGFINSTRINYYQLMYFIIPLLFLIIVFILNSSAKKK
jgi:hypothetical protein